MKHVVVIALLMWSAPLAAQEANTASSPVADATRRWLQLEAKNLIAAAEEMPAEKYSFRPTAEQMTFAKLMTHVVESNRYMCSAIGREPLPSESGVTDADDKAKIVADVKMSFEYCGKMLAAADDARLAEQVPVFKRTRADLMMFLIADHADHYATAAMHLRLNGLVPPTAQPKK
jgi:uncharacterized damage-inducible protein DinB